jgi:hypothetical protein
MKVHAIENMRTSRYAISTLPLVSIALQAYSHEERRGAALQPGKHSPCCCRCGATCDALQ